MCIISLYATGVTSKLTLNYAQSIRDHCYPSSTISPDPKAIDGFTQINHGPRQRGLLHRVCAGPRQFGSSRLSDRPLMFEARELDLLPKILDILAFKPTKVDEVTDAVKHAWISTQPQVHFFRALPLNLLHKRQREC
jgi:hypothetical protein